MSIALPEQRLHRYLAEYDVRYNHRIANDVGDKASTVEELKESLASA